MSNQSNNNDESQSKVTNCCVMKSVPNSVMGGGTQVQLATQFDIPMSSGGSNRIALLSTSPPFSSQHMFDTPHAIHMTSDLCDPQLTPVNLDRSFSFGTSGDSGTESLCGSESIVDDEYDGTATARVLQFFSSNNSKSTRLGDRQAAIRSTQAMAKPRSKQDSTEDEECYSDESTLSESSALSSPDFAFPSTETITPESVVAAIDKKLKKTKLVDEDSDSKDPGPETNRPSSTESKFERRVSNGSVTDDSGLCFEHDHNLLDPNRVPLIRSTSLKTGKTPPGTPAAKKIVRFADALGLDLESVRHIADDVPYVPPLAAYKCLHLDEEEQNWVLSRRTTIGSTSPLPTLRPSLQMLFCQPCSEPTHFLERVRTNKICMENCVVSGPAGPVDLFTITCLVRVMNISFEKHVTLRYTTNEWLTFTDVNGTYVANSCDGFSDKFTATFGLAVNSNGHQTMMPGQRLLFAFKYSCSGGEEHWDNNMGLNYALIYRRSSNP